MLLHAGNLEAERTDFLSSQPRSPGGGQDLIRAQIRSVPKLGGQHPPRLDGIGRSILVEEVHDQ